MIDANLSDTSAASPAQAAPSSKNAGKWRRFFTFCIDIVCYYFICIMVGIILALILGPSFLDNLHGLKGFFFFSIPIFFLYYIGFEFTLSRTIGKFVTGTKVEAVTGGKPTLMQIFLRTLCRHIPCEAFSLFWSDENLAWHDELPKTKVVIAR